MFLLRRLFRIPPPDLSVALIRDNPWSAIYLRMPLVPTKLLLDLALIAADYCRTSEKLVIDEFRKTRDYVDPVPQKLEDDIMHAEQACELAHDRWREMQELYHELYFYLVP